MKKLFFILGGLLLSFSSQAQLFDEIKKEENINDSKVFYTASTGIGFGSYSYEQNKISNTYGLPQPKTSVFSVSFPVSIYGLYNAKWGYIGGGIKWHNVSGSTYEVVTADKQKINLSMLKYFARLELPFTLAKKAGFGMSCEIGSFIPLTVEGSSASSPFFGNVGVNYIFKLTSKSSLLLESVIELDKFNTEINDRPSKHSVLITEIGVGLRFGS